MSRSTSIASTSFDPRGDRSATHEQRPDDVVSGRTYAACMTINEATTATTAFATSSST